MKYICTHVQLYSIQLRNGFDNSVVLISALDTKDTQVKRQVFELLSALCVYSAEGYSRALEALEHYKQFKSERYRFRIVVSELQTAKTAEYKTVLQLMNASRTVLYSPDCQDCRIQDCPAGIHQLPYHINTPIEGILHHFYFVKSGLT